MGAPRVRDDELFLEHQGKRHRAVERSCEHCGALFLALQSQSRPGAGRFCSRRCARSRQLTDRFWEKVAVRDEGCWEWQGNRERAGYGILGASQHRPAAKAHRVSWELHSGPIPDGLWVLHHCDNPPCVRPDHLYLGTATDNARDRATRMRGRENRQGGPANPNAKLSESDVREIIAALRSGDTQQAVAARFGIKQPQVSRIARRQSWQHLWDE